MGLLLKIFEHHLIEILVCVFTLGGLSVSGVVATVGRNLAPFVLIGGMIVAGYFWRDRLNDVIGPPSGASVSAALTPPAEANGASYPPAANTPPPSPPPVLQPAPVATIPAPEKAPAKRAARRTVSPTDVAPDQAQNRSVQAARPAIQNTDPASCPANRRGLSGTCYASVPTPYVPVRKVGSFCFDPFGRGCP